MVNPECDKCLESSHENECYQPECEECPKGYGKKEIILAEADGNAYIHGDKFESQFVNDHYESYIGTQYKWKGKVKITIEQVEE